MQRLLTARCLAAETLLHSKRHGQQRQVWQSAIGLGLAVLSADGNVLKQDVLHGALVTHLQPALPPQQQLSHTLSSRAILAAWPLSSASAADDNAAFL